MRPFWEERVGVWGRFRRRWYCWLTGGNLRGLLSGFTIESRVRAPRVPRPSLPSRSCRCTGAKVCTYIQPSTSVYGSRARQVPADPWISGRPSSRDHCEKLQQGAGWPIPLRRISLSQSCKYSKGKAARIQPAGHSQQVKAPVLSCCLRFESYLTQQPPGGVWSCRREERESSQRGRAYLHE